MLAFAALALLASCGDGGPGDDDEPTYTLTVMVQQDLTAGDGLYTEGALPEVRLIGPDGTEILPTKDHTRVAEFTGLAPGAYTLIGGQRPCDGNCDNLDDLVDTCEQSITVDKDRTIRVRLVAGQPCTAKEIWKTGRG